MSATLDCPSPPVDLRKQEGDRSVTEPPRISGSVVALTDRTAAIVSMAGPATRGAVAHTWLSAAGTWRLTGAAWTWVIAKELSPQLVGKTELVLNERKRRRKIATFATLGMVVGAEQIAVRSWPLAVVVAAVLFVAAGVAERRIRASLAGEQTGRKRIGRRPGSKAVRRGFVAARLGKADEIRVVGAVARDRGMAWTAVVELPAGVTASQAQRKLPEISSAYGVDQRQLSVDPIRGHEGRVLVWCADSDPLAGPSMQSPVLDLQRFDVWNDGIPMLFDVRGRPVKMSLIERSILVGGEPGGGKSVACNNLLCAMALDPTVRLWLADGKGVDLLDYEDLAERFMSRPDPPALVDLLREAVAEMQDRYKVMARYRVKKITYDIAADLEIYPLLMHIDELAFFTRSQHGDEITELLRDYVSRGRAALMMLSAATQRPSKDVVKPDLRDLIPVKMAMRCTTPESSDMTLGRGWAGQGFNAATFDASQKGAAFLLSEGGLPVRGRTGLLTDAQVTALTRRAYRLREEAGTLPKSDARPAVRLLKQVLSVMGEAERTPTAILLERLDGDWTAELLAAELRPLGVAPGQLWIDGTNVKGYARKPVLEALDRV